MRPRARTIRLLKVAGKRGVREIEVDGVVWGEIVPRHFGPSGIEYYFRQIDSPLLIKDIGGRQPVSVATDALHRRREDIPYVLDSLDDRLLDRVRELVTLRLLRHPDEAKRSKEKAQRTARAKVEACLAREREAFEARARAAIRASALPVETDQLLVEMIKAMQWARTR